MRLPFTTDQFLALFATYNNLLWPAVVALWVITLIGIVQLLRGRANHRLLSALLTLHWVWSGAVYHGGFFTRINPAAWLFAVLFVGQAGAFLWVGVVQGRLQFEPGRTTRHAAAAAFLVLSLAYPFLAILSGHPWPGVPVFAVPCPTLLFTTGMLLMLAPPLPRGLFVVPIGWALTGGSAAIVLGITPDLLLVAAAIALAMMVVSRASVRDTDNAAAAGNFPR